MKIFISWSGEKSASQILAEGLAGWLEDVLPQVKPFFSTEDIKKGQAWFDKIALELESSDFGILCLTPLNLTSPWMLFEAGAIAKKVGKSKVVPLALGMALTDLKPPLSMFNGAVPTKEEIRRLLASINGELGESAFDEKKLDRAFEKWWPDLEKTIAKAHEALKASSGTKAHPEKRSSEDMLAELLNLVRALARRDPPIDAGSLFGFGAVPRGGAGSGGGAFGILSGSGSGGTFGGGGLAPPSGGLIGRAITDVSSGGGLRFAPVNISEANLDQLVAALLRQSGREVNVEAPKEELLKKKELKKPKE